MTGKFILPLFVAASLTVKTYGQGSAPSEWTLQSAVAYARAHNLDVRQKEVVNRGSHYFYQQSRLAQLPNVSFNSSYGRSFGTNIDPTTNSYTKNTYDYLTFTGTASVLVFGWMQQRNTIIKNKLAMQASEADLQQARDEVSWAVATSFLRVLISWEQMKVNEKQVGTTQSQIGNTSKFVKAGALPDLSLAQLQAQLAGDSAQFIKSQSELNAAVVDMKALLGLPQSAPFNVSPPDADELAATSTNLLDPEQIYTVAEQRMGSVRGIGLRALAAQKELAAAKGALLPQLSFNAQFVTAYSTSAKNYEVTGSAYVPISGTYVQGAGGTKMDVYQQVPTSYNSSIIPFGQQLSDFFRNIYFFNLSMPVFSGWNANYNVRRARLNLEETQLAQDEVRQKLRQEVYKAYNDARNSIQTYTAARRATEAQQRALKYAQARMFVGMTNMTDYISILNAQYIAESKQLSAKYDMFYKIKLVDFYMGRDLKL